MNFSIISACTPYLHRFLMEIPTGLMGTHIPEQLELDMSRRRTMFSTKEIHSCTLASQSPQFNSSTKLEEAESDSTNGLTHDGVLCTTDIRVDVEQGGSNTHAIVEEVATSNNKDFYNLA